MSKTVLAIQRLLGLSHRKRLARHKLSHRPGLAGSTIVLSSTFALIAGYFVPLAATAADCTVNESTQTFNSVQYRYVAIKSGSSCTYTFPSSVLSFDALIVGGGGGGGSRHGGGGSSGQFQEITGRSITSGTTLTLTIGSGGAGGGSSSGQSGSDGTATTITGNNSFVSITSNGGQGGRWTQDSNQRGTSGNGFRSGLGGSGGYCTGTTSGWCGGGGAGSSSDGQNADQSNNNRAGNGGSGSTPTLFDSTIASVLAIPASYSGGGGGGADIGGTAGTATNGGGNGSVGDTNAPAAGVANSGGGGGGSGYNNLGGQQAGGTGGSGLVVLRFQTAPLAPTITSVTPRNTQLSISFTAPTSNGSQITSYQYSLNAGTTWTSAGSSSPFTISGLTNWTAYSVIVRAINSNSAGPASNSVSGTPIPTDLDLNAKLSSSGSSNWIDQTTGNNISVTAGQNFPTWNATNKFFSFDSGVQVFKNNTYTNPSSFSIEIWFRTTQTGSKIIGFQNASGAGTVATSYDRHLYVDTDGKLRFGMWNPNAGTAQIIVTDLAVNDGNWHHAIATFTGTTAELYLDNSRKTSTFAATQSYSGVWVVGGGALNGWPSAGANGPAFQGDIGLARIYNSVLTTTQATDAFNSIKSQQSVTLTLNSNYGTPTTQTQQINFDSATAIQSNPFSRTGFAFGGWTVNSDGTGTSYTNAQQITLKSDRTIFAKWSVNNYSVTYDEKGGSPVSDGTFSTGGSVTLPAAPTKAGFIFGGWSATDGGSPISSPYSPGVTSNITIYAIWLAISPPTGVTATAGNQSVTVNWTAPANSASQPPTAYRVEYSTTGTGSWTTADATISSSARTYQITGLTNNTAYYVRVAAVYAGVIGAYGYPWTLIFESTTPYRVSNEISYTSTNGLTGNDITLTRSDFSRVRYYVGAKYASGDATRLYVDANFDKAISNSATGGDTYTNLYRLQVPLTVVGTFSQFEIHGNISDLDVLSNYANVTEGKGLSGRLEIWPWDYAMAAASGLIGGTNSASFYDDGDSWTTGGYYGSFQLHNIGSNAQTIFAWNKHFDTNWYEIGFGTSTRAGSNPDWTFEGGAAGYTKRADFLFQSYANLSVTPIGSYTITLNRGANGTGADQTLAKTQSQALTLPDSATANSYFTRTGYTVSGWTTTDAGNQTHALGGSFTTDAATTLYPVWASTLAITTPSSGLSATVGQSYSLSISTSGGTGTKSYSATGLPNGLSINSSGVISGTPTAAGNSTVAVTVTDTTGSKTTSNFTISVAQVPLANAADPTVTATAGTLKSLSVTWTAVSNASSYTLKLYASNGTTLLHTITGASGTSRTITASDYASLADNTAYRVSIQAIGTGNYTSSAESGKISATTLQSYSVTYNANDATDGSTPSPQLKAAGGSVTISSNSRSLARPGYAFSGWNTQANGLGTDFSAGATYSVDASLTLYAKWQLTPNRDFDAGNSSSYPGTGTSWTDLVSGTSYTISSATYANDKGGALVWGASGRVEIGSPIANGGSFTMEAWVKASGTSGSRAILGSTSTFGSTVSALYIDGSTLRGSLSASGYVSSANFPNNVWKHVALSFDDPTNTITLYIDGVSVSSTNSATNSYSSGPVFIGSAGVGLWPWQGSIARARIYQTALSGAQVLARFNDTKAVYAASTFQITYNANGATGGAAPSAQTKTEGVNLTLATNSGNLVRTGYTFAGWNTEANGSGTSYSAGGTYTVEAADELFARWTANTYTITYNSNSGSSASNGSFTVGGSGLTLPTVTRTGYTFAGWHEASDFSGNALTSPYSPTQTRTVYAKWTANTYTVTYTYNSADGGIRPTTDSFTTGGSAITLPTPTRSRHVFGGWYAEVGLATLVGVGGASYSPTADVTLYAKWTDTLVVDLDATQSSSYSGTGTTWSNIAPGSSPASATLDAAAMYSAEFGGVMNTTSNRKATTASTALTLDNSIGFTMEVWVRFNAVNTAQGVASYDGGGKYINFYKAGNSGMRWEVSASNAVTDSTVVVANTWYHYVGTCKNNTAVLYRNGVQAVSSSGRTCTTNQSAAFLVGNIQGIQMDGSVSLFRFYTSALTADEVLARYNATKSRTTYTVTYNYDSADGGNSTASATYASGGSAIVLPTPTKTNSTFAGWYSDSNKTVLAGNAGANYTPTGASSAITLYAKWTTNSFTVTFNANDGSGSPATSTQAINSGVATAITANAFTRTGYTFAGWNTLANGTGTNYTNQQSVTLSGNLTLYAKWTANTYTVTYTYNSADGGTRPTTDSFTVGGSAITLPTPTRTGYTFAGWYAEVGLSTLIGNAGASYSPTGSVTIYAKWTANSNTVTFKSNYVGGAVDSTQSIVTAVATGLTSNAFTRAGYVFSGWNTLANGTGTNYTDGQSVTLTGALTLYAKWSAGIYTVTYNYNSATGGASAASGNYTTGGTQLVLPVPTKTGYTFGGWYDASDFSGSALASSITTTSSKIIYAKWTAATFTVLYEYNGATAGDSTASATYTTASTTITLPTPTKTGYTFAGWYESSNFSGSAVTTPYTTSQNRSLYAKWTAVNYTVTYNANLVVSGNTITGTGSVPVNNNTYNIGQSFSVAANTGPLTRSGYTFAGWVTNEDGSGTAKNSGETITFGAANINLYPKWTANTYTISYNLNGGSGDLTSAPTSWTVGTSNVTLPSSGFSRTGYNFAGWSMTQGGAVIDNSFNNIGNITLYAAWTLKSISYTFDKGTAAGQSIASWPSNSSANFGSSITLPTPSNTVTINAVTYQFFGWEYSGTTYQPGSSFTLSETAPTFVAQWVRLYDVRYAYAGGTHSVAGDTDDECVTGGLCLQDQDINLRTAPTRAGYNFIGWRVQDTNTTKAAGALHRVIATGYLFYANWQAIDYVFSFNSSGGSDSHSSVTANIGQLVTMPNPGFRTGYTFAGWSPDNGTTKYTTGSTYLVGTASKAFVAYWTPNVYTVVYDWQGASGTPTPDASYTVGTGAMTLPLIGDRTKDGYTFGGWSETPGGTAVTNFTPTANDVLYAIWNDGNYTLSYDGRGASAGSGQGTVNRGASVTLPTPVRAGFVFNGWYDDATAGNKVGNGGASHTPGRSKTLYAHWVQRSLHGVDPATLESGQEYTASDNTGVDTTITHNPTNTSARIQVPSGALPNGTKVNVQYFKDTDRQSNLIPGNNSYFFSVLVSWLYGSGTNATVPNTNAGKPITVTLNNSSIKAGAMVYMVIGDQVSELGRATQDGTVTVTLTEDPEIVVAATAPGNPASIVASSGNQEATVSWAAPSTNGGAQIVSYTVTASPGGASCTTATTSCTVTGLTNGTAYTFSVVATNSVGSSTGANSSSITPALATYTVIFNSNGGSNVSNGSFTSGGSVSEPTAPSRSGYTFDGWSTVQNSAASKVSFPYTPGVTNNITLYALWTQVQSSGGGSAPGPTSTPTPTPTPTVTPGPTAPPSQIGFKPTPPPTPVRETGPVGSVVGSTEKVTVVADAPSEKIIATAGDWKLEIKPPVIEQTQKPVTEKLELQFPVAAKAEIAGSGMQPNTTVEAWVFSQPRYLGTLKVGADGKFASTLALPKDLLPGQHTLQIGSLNSQGRLVTISVPITIKGSVSVGTFRGFVSIFTKDLEGQQLTAKVAGKWITQNPIRRFKNFSYSRLVRLTGAGYDIRIDVYINKKFYKSYTTRTR